MDRNQILNVIENLSHSQGFYGRILHKLRTLKEQDEEKYEQVMSELEAKNFKDELELILYFET